MKEKIAVLGANQPLIPFYRQAKNLGYEIIGIAWEEGSVCKKYCDKFYPISFVEKDKVLEVCRKENVKGITSFSLESALPTVVHVAQHMGLVSNSEDSLLLTQSKYTQRQALELAAIAVPRYYQVGKESDLGKIDCHYPVIVKPVDSGGSQGISKVETCEGLEEAYSYALGFSRTHQVIVEEFIDGREFSVESISHKGHHYFLQITDKVTSGAPRFVEIQHHQPANISNETHAAILDLVAKALTALKINNSPSHTEIKLSSKNELFIIEIGARMGGDFITSDLVRLSTGYDMVKGAIELALDRFCKPQITNMYYSGVYFYSQLAPSIGEIIRNHQQWPQIIECELVEGELPEVKSNADRGGYFLYQSSEGKFVF